MDNSIRKNVTISPITVDEIRKSNYKDKNGKEIFNAILRQKITVVSFYPAKQVSNDFQNNIFKPEDFGYTAEPFESVENRIAFLPVPENTTVEKLTEMLKGYPKAKIYRQLSLKPILHSGQLYKISTKELTMKDVENAQQVIDKDGVIVHWEGFPVYRTTHFDYTGLKEDIDHRSEDLKSMQVSNETIINAIENAQEAIETNEGSFMKTE